ncbi:winged helix-turn-helix transcriptional regulator [Streptomyces sp. NPDC059567]|uniref:winged helix-turn-helix transcriptional regulator n=1 Tax=Streptomyces sp. NPDC059567 TaxID=3346867 RepID=UPI0036BBDCBD
MKWLETDTANCSVGRTLDVVGEKWSLLIVRDAFNGVRRYEEFRRHIGLSEAVLADRLRKLTAAGILRAEPYREPGTRTRSEYRLTPKGRDLWPVLLALKQWGDAHAADPEGPSLDIRHTGCGAPVRVVVECQGEEHATLGPSDVSVRPGPGARPLAH